MKVLVLWIILCWALVSSSNALDKDEVAAADLGAGDEVETISQPDPAERLSERPGLRLEQRVSRLDVAGSWRTYASGGILLTELHYYQDGSFEFANLVQDVRGGYGWQRWAGTWSVDGSTLTEFRTTGQARQFTIVSLTPHRLLQLKNSDGKLETYLAGLFP
jgi:hypothetical protein